MESFAQNEFKSEKADGKIERTKARNTVTIGGRIPINFRYEIKKVRSHTRGTPSVPVV